MKLLEPFKSDPNGKPDTYWLTRFVLLRGMGFVYFWAFLSAALQAKALYGEQGLLPIGQFIEAVQGDASLFDAFIERPTLFHFFTHDFALTALGWIGAALALAVLLGYANSIIMALLWLLYMSYVNAGQLFFGFGWESQTLELGFLMIFLCPLWDARPFPKHETPLPIIWLFRFFLFKFYVGAGLIKLRGSECWQDFTCLFYHFETQPIPNPLSPIMHALPEFILKFGVMFTEFLQVIAAFFVFYPRLLRILAGLIFFTFQSILILTGNYSFFNWVTWVPALVLFDDRFLSYVLPNKLVQKAQEAEANKVPVKPFQNNLVYAVFGVLIWLSLPVLDNLVSKDQVMNRSYSRWALSNSYGAFGYVGTKRYELVVSGTSDAVVGPDTVWKEYEFVAKPTDVTRGLPIIAPYQPRLDWQIWFAAQSDSSRHGWLIHVLWKFLHNDEHVLGLIEHNPFPDQPPAHIKVDRYLYEFEPPFSGNTWRRTFVEPWMGSLNKENQSLQDFIQSNNWHMYE